jgi:predicted MPP superfamily phosphohydrolase
VDKRSLRLTQWYEIKMPIFLIIISGIPLLSLLWWLWADRRLKRFGAGLAWRWGLGTGSLLLLAGFVWVVLARCDVVHAQIPSAWYGAVLLWALLFLPLIALPSMLIWALGSVGRRFMLEKPALGDKPSGQPLWNRRTWLGAVPVGLPMVATWVTTFATIPQLKRFRVREIHLNLPDLPEAFEGLRIAHLTDTHVGKFTHGNLLEEIVETTNALQADLILFTGDLIDNSIRDLPEAVRMLQKLRAKSGVFAVEGNHDLFDDPRAFVAGVRAGGIALLRNQAVTLQVRGFPLQILGIVWNHNEAAMSRDIQAVAALRDPTAFPILLAHHPHAFDQAAELGIPLTLAGHTHGGQLMITDDIGTGPAIFRYWSGLYEKGGRGLVVGNGTGNWFPLRTNAPAEIIHLTLRRG